MKPHPDSVLAELKSTIGKRAHPNFDILHEVCREIHNAAGANKDYSPSAVGRLTQGRGGPSLNTLLAPGGKHFRTLIEAWAAYSGTDTKRPNHSVAKVVKDDIMDAIEDPVLRSLVGPKMAELRRVKAELNLLKSKTIGTVDLRPRISGGEAKSLVPSANAQLVAAPSGLLDIERDALGLLLNEKWRTRAGLKAGENGEVSAHRPFRTGEDILPVGFLDALGKLLLGIAKS